MLEPREMTANIPRMQKALGLEKLKGEEVRDLLKKMSSLVDRFLLDRFSLEKREEGKRLVFFLGGVGGTIVQKWGLNELEMFEGL